VAHEARAAVHEVDVAQKGHDKICAIRYESIAVGMKSQSDSIKGLYNRFWAAAVGVILVLLGIASFQYQQSEDHQGEFETMFKDYISQQRNK